MTELFTLFSIFCIYTYLLYPVIVALIAKCRRLPQINYSDIESWPSVSVVIAVHNEQAHIENKLINLRALEYEGDLELVVVSDGSTDNTNDFLHEQTDVSFFYYSEAQGKPTALNIGVEKANGEIIVFMDARQTVSLNCIYELVKYFSLDEVGAVSGELVMKNAETGEAENIGLYWRYEKWIRLNESRWFSTAGATGALYAIRKSSYAMLAKSTLLDDFDIPINSLRNGKRTLFIPEAVAFDTPSKTGQDEFARKLRTLTGNYQSFSRNIWLFNPLTNRIFVQFISHKVFRLLVPYAMLGALISSALSDNDLVKVFFVVQVLFYLSGIIAIASAKASQIKLLNVIKVFLQLNFAAVLALYFYLFRNSEVKWKSV